MTINLVGPINSGAASGGAGAATANATTTHDIIGIVRSIAVRYNDSPPAGTDVVIATAGLAAPALTILTLTNNNSDGWWQIEHDAVDAAGSSSSGHLSPPIADKVKVTIAQANDGDSVDVWLCIEV